VLSPCGLGWCSGYGTALLVGGSRDRSPVTGDFFPGHQRDPCALVSTQPLKMSTRIFLGYRWPVHKGELTTFMCRVSRNSGALPYRNLKGH
jgi:hypothetical protein